MEIIVVCAIVLVLTIGSIALLARRKKAGAHRVDKASTRVDNYVLSVEEKEGFHFVRMKLQTDDGSFSYDLDPNYSHVLSDELLTTSALALRNAHAPAK